ncbi:MAG: hypothetical protein RL367_2228 [Pseudomonadota bacterium]
MNTNGFRNRCGFGTTALLLAGCASLVPAQAQERTITTVFGDSGVEQGNLYALTGQDRANTPYFTKDSFSRESNGPVWVEFLVPDITPLLGAEIGTRHVNYAFSGATSGQDNLATPISSGLAAQIDVYAARRASGAPVPKSGDVFVLAAGTNDFIRDVGQRDLQLTSAGVVTNITASVARLSGLGAPTILVEDVANFLAAPAFNTLVPAPERVAFDTAVATVLASHRANQRAALRQVLARLPSDRQIAIVPLQSLFAHVVKNAAALGFKSVNTACYDETNGTVCSDDPAVQNSLLFFDSLHLSARGQVLQALYYAALIDQLGGGGHSVAGRILGDTRGLSGMVQAADQRLRMGAWLEPDPAHGWALIGDTGFGRHSDPDAPGSRGGSRDTTMLRFGIGVADGHGLTARIIASHVTGTTGLLDGGGHHQSGQSVSASGEARLGKARFGLALGGLWGRTVNGIRPINVPLMQAGYATQISALSGEVSAGWLWSSGGWQALPSASLGWNRVRFGGYDETGNSGLNLAFRATSDSAVRAIAGLTISHRGWQIGSVKIEPWLSAQYGWRLGKGRRLITAELIDNVARPISAVVGTAAGQQAVLEPGLRIGSGDKVQLNLFGRHVIGADDQTAGARVSLRF